MEATTANTAKTTDGRAERAADTPVVDKAAVKARDALERAVETAATAEKTVRQGSAGAAEKAHEAGDQVKALGAQAQANLEEQSEKVGRYVKENPLTSVGIAFAAGLVLSRIIRS
ncbi:MAG: hypothetical protein RIC89_21330 [Pseudomonadales bacterium]